MASPLTIKAKIPRGFLAQTGGALTHPVNGELMCDRLADGIGTQSAAP
jgi:hypothetical protein